MKADAGARATPAGAAGVFAPMSMYRTAPFSLDATILIEIGRKSSISSVRSNTAVKSSPTRLGTSLQPTASKKRRRPARATLSAILARTPLGPLFEAVASSRSSRSPSDHSRRSGSRVLPLLSRQISRCSEP
eukprot:scaffold318005_cov32-Tisochrysis_lutea.AAC.1